jgi:hypothetical protein
MPADHHLAKGPLEMLITESREPLFWQRDSMHWPSAVTVMEADVFERVYARGFCAAAEGYSMPVRIILQRTDGYIYLAVYPVSRDPEFLAALGDESERRLTAQ